MQEKEWTRAFGRCNSWSTRVGKLQRRNDHAGRKPRRGGARECCRVGRANNSNVFGQFFEQESQRYLTFTMIRTPSSYGRARGVSFNMMMRMETRSTTGSS
jgi:hypothetical protein